MSPKKELESERGDGSANYGSRLSNRPTSFLKALVSYRARRRLANSKRPRNLVLSSVLDSTKRSKVSRAGLKNKRPNVVVEEVSLTSFTLRTLKDHFDGLRRNARDAHSKST